MLRRYMNSTMHNNTKKFSLAVLGTIGLLVFEGYLHKPGELKLFCRWFVEKGCISLYSIDDWSGIKKAEKLLVKLKRRFGSLWPTFILELGEYLWGILNWRRSIVEEVRLDVWWYEDPEESKRREKQKTAWQTGEKKNKKWKKLLTFGGGFDNI